MKTYYYIIFGVLLMLGVSACTTEANNATTPVAQQAFVDTTDDGVQDIRLSYGKVGPSFNYIFSSNTVRVGEPVRIIADVASLKGCYRYIQIPQYDISKYVTENENTVEFTPTETGEIIFTCSMGMGTAKLYAE